MPLSILTLNLWHDRGPWPQRAELVRAWIRELRPDLIALQEVLRGPGVDQLAEILEGSEYRGEFLHAQDFWIGDGISFGNAIATRFPVRSRRELVLPDSGDGERRSALSLEVEAPVGPVSFTSTHLNWKFHHGPVRERQVAALARDVIEHRPKDGFPPIIAGDFNAEPDSDEIRFMTGRHAIEDRGVYFNDAWAVAGQGESGLTWCNRNPYARTALEPDRRIDYVFAGYPTLGGVGLFESCRVVCDREQSGAWPSDHFGVYAELRREPLDDLWQG